MSRYRFVTPSFAEVVVGWDGATYFAEALEYDDPDKPGRKVLGVGIGSVGGLEETLASEGFALPNALLRQLDADRARAHVRFRAGDAVLWEDQGPTRRVTRLAMVVEAADNIGEGGGAQQVRILLEGTETTVDTINLHLALDVSVFF